MTPTEATKENEFVFRRFGDSFPQFLNDFWLSIPLWLLVLAVLAIVARFGYAYYERKSLGLVKPSPTTGWLGWLAILTVSTLIVWVLIVFYKRDFEQVKGGGVPESALGTSNPILWSTFVGVVFGLSSLFVILAYLRDSRSVRWYWATKLAILRITVYAILCFVFLLPAVRTNERISRTSHVVILIDVSESMTGETDEVEVKNRKPKYRMDTLIEFLTDDNVMFIQNILKDNPIVLYPFGTRIDELPQGIARNENAWGKKEWEAFARYDFRPFLLKGLSEQGKEEIQKSEEWNRKTAGSVDWASSWFARKKEPDADWAATWFAGRTFDPNKPDPDVHALKDNVAKLDKRIDLARTIAKGTNVPDSITAALTRESANMAQAIIVFSDGRSNLGSDTGYRDLRNRAIADKIPVLTVAVGENRDTSRIVITDLQADETISPDEGGKIVVEADGINLAFIKLSSESFDALRKEKIPEDVLAKLTVLKDRQFKSQDDLEREINGLLDKSEIERFRKLIVKQAATESTSVTVDLDLFYFGKDGKEGKDRDLKTAPADFTLNAATSPKKKPYQLTFVPGNPPHGHTDFVLDPANLAETEQGKKLTELTQAKFKVTNATIAALRLKKVPEVVLDRLKPVRDREFDSADDLERELPKDEETKQFRQLIVHHAGTGGPAITKRVLKEGVWAVRARIPKHEKEAFPDPEHVQVLTGIIVSRKALRVLLMAGAPSREFQFLRTFLVREVEEKRATVTLLVQNDAGGSGNLTPEKTEQVITRIPTRADKTPTDEERPYNLSEYDLIVAFDPDFSELTLEQATRVGDWVKAGGGLLFIADRINTPDTARRMDPEDKENYDPKLDPIRDVLPVKLDNAVSFKERSQNKPRRLNLTPLSYGDLLKIDDRTSNPIAGWERYFTDRDFYEPQPLPAELEPHRGFYSCYPVKQPIEPGTADVLAVYKDLKLKVRPSDPDEEVRRPWLVMSPPGAGYRTCFMGSGETYRMLAYDKEYYERYWAKLLNYVGGKRGADKGTPRAQIVMSKEVISGTQIRFQARILNPSFAPYPMEGAGAIEPKFKIVSTADNGDKQEQGPYSLSPTEFPGYYRGEVKADPTLFPPGETEYRVLITDVPDLPEDRIKKSLFRVVPSNPEKDDVRMDAGAMSRMATDFDAAFQGRFKTDAAKAEFAASLKIKENGIPKLTFGLADKDALKLIPQCFESKEEHVNSRGKPNDLWEKGIEFPNSRTDGTFLERNVPGFLAGGKIPISWVMMLVIGILCWEWTTRKLLRLA